jgi:hypothetical protein
MTAGEASQGCAAAGDAASTAGRAHETIERPLARGTRRLMLVYAGLGLAAGVPLFLGSESTDTYFAWTIKPPLTAAFLGANYWATFVFYLLSSRERTWARGRIALPAGLVFTSLMLLATLLSLDRFHLGAGGLVARFVAWVWLVVYVSVPPLTLAFLVYQARLPGTVAARGNSLEPLLRLTLATQAVVMAGLGIALVAAPVSVGAGWPWPLTPLTARAAGAWLAGVGLAAAQVAWENDLTRVRWAFISFASLAVLQGVALARYPHTVDWHSGPIWAYVAFLGSLFAVGAFGMARAALTARQLRHSRVTYGAR